jgi:ATP-dependent DNA helicase DinG
LKYGDQIFEQVMKSMNLEPRPQQTKLIGIAREAISDQSTRFAQAGTGTGKSYVMLTAALEAARTNSKRLPSVVVCPTNNLIDQYVHTDAPKIAQATGGRFEYLKGRNRYLCTASFSMSQEPDPNELFKKFVKDGKLEWAQHGLDNSWGCSGDCDDALGDLCAVQIARFEASKAEVVITNGHLLVWDWRVLGFTNGANGLLPAFNTLFVDEAHALDDVGRSCMSDQIKRNSAVFREIPGLDIWVAGMTAGLTEFNRERSVESEGDEQLAGMVAQSTKELDRLDAQLEVAVAEQDRAMARVIKKQMRAHQRFVDFATPDEYGRFISTITLENQGGTDLEPALNTLCVDSSFIFRDILTRQPSVLVSGTVPQTLPRRMGVSDAPLEDVGTPFDYSRSTLAISSHRGNDPKLNWNRVQETVAAVNDMCGRSHEQGGGGTLILFTSWKDLNEVMPHVAKGLKRSVPVLAQSQTDPADTDECLRIFKAHGHAVMGGVTSMWTGVDVPGDALRQVIIYRLPWGVPTLEVKAIEKIHGRQVYSDSMLQTLAQGIGRLVRTTEDTGRVYIADSRAKNIRWTQSPLTRHVAKFSTHARRVNT